MRTGWLGRVAALLGVLALVVPEAFAETRVALVIGNSAYSQAPPLANPRRDAELMAASLEQVGFAVTKMIDVDQRSMKKALRDFGRSLRGSDAVGLFYYAGHGVQVSGENYLVPIDANISDETEVGFESVNVNEFLATMKRAQARINIIVLDACRDNPFASGSRSGTRGLARVEAPSGSFIAYATSPGAVALDGTGSNSPYAGALARAIATPGLTIEQVFKKTRREVQGATGAKQTPWETSSITGEFYFLGKPGAGTGKTSPPVEPAPAVRGQDRSAEIAFWETIKNGADKALFDAYLKQFPNGTFAALARLKIKALDARAAAPPAGPAPATEPEPSDRQAFLVPRVVLPQSSRVLLTANAVRGLSCEQLWVARNEVFDRNGYCFRSARGKAYFNNADCRTSKQNILTRLERQNVDVLRGWERRKGCR